MLLMMGEDTTRKMQSSFPEINKLCKVASCWKYEYIKRNTLTIHGPLNTKPTKKLSSYESNKIQQHSQSSNNQIFTESLISVSFFLSFSQQSTIRPYPQPHESNQQPHTYFLKRILTFKRRIKSHLPFAGIIRSSPYSPRFQDNG